MQYLEDLRNALQNGDDVVASKKMPVLIGNFSNGYKGNGLAGRLKNSAHLDSETRPIKRIEKIELSQHVSKKMRREQSNF